MEWSFDVESIFFIEFTLGGFTLPFINIDDVPLLMDLTIFSFVTLDVSSFRISFTLNVKIFTFLISDVSTFSSE
jgi:hypothetical protein